MALMRSEFVVFGDLVLEPTAPKAVTLIEDDQVKITLGNGDIDGKGHISSLIGKVIGPCDNLRSAEGKHRALLALALDHLALITLHRFKIGNPIRVIEWDPGQEKRRMLVYHKIDGRYPPLPNLFPEFLKSAQHFATNRAGAPILAAMKYLRYGINAESSEDQFVKFWHAVDW
jgi:hypothetical protein